MEKSTLDEVLGPSLVGLRASDGPTNESGNNKLLGPEMRASDGPTNESGNDKLLAPEKQRTWTKRTRMDYGPVETLKESANLVLGKQTIQTQQ